MEGLMRRFENQTGSPARPTPLGFDRPASAAAIFLRRKRDASRELVDAVDAVLDADPAVEADAAQFA